MLKFKNSEHKEVPFKMINADIAELRVDAIVNSTNPELIGGSGVDLLLHSLGGSEFEKECEGAWGTLNPGEAIVTKAGGMLPCKYIIHTCGPHYMGGEYGEDAILRSCYEQSLMLAEDLGIHTVAFPLISSGFHGFPVDRALEIAVKTINRFVEHSNLQVILTIYGAAAEEAASIVIPGLAEADMLEEVCYDESEDFMAGAAPAEAASCQKQSFKQSRPSEKRKLSSNAMFAVAKDSVPQPELAAECVSFESIAEPEIGESLREMILRLENERGMSDSDVYNAVGINRAAFNKIINGKTLNPSRQTMAGIAIAMKLDYETAEELMKAAGLAFSNNNKFDIIISSCLREGYYDLWEINAALFARGLPTIGVID